MGGAVAGAGLDFLLFLDALLQRDRGPPGFSGRLAIGVRSGDQELWCCVSAAAAVKSELQGKRPVDVDASLLLGQSDARAILEQKGLPERPELLEIGGDRALIARFVERYLKTRNPLQARFTR